MDINKLSQNWKSLQNSLFGMCDFMSSLGNEYALLVFFNHVRETNKLMNDLIDSIKFEDLIIPNDFERMNELLDKMNEPERKISLVTKKTEDGYSVDIVKQKAEN